MGFAEGSYSRLYIGKTTALNTEPTTYNPIIPISHSLEPNFGSFKSEDIDPSGSAVDTFRTSGSGRGDVAEHWRPDSFDGVIETLYRSTIAGALSATGLDVAFGTPSALGIQSITASAGTPFAAVVVGDHVLVAGTLTSAANGGIKRVMSKTSSAIIGVYNPSGVLDASDTPVSVTHVGKMSLGTTTSWQWIERMFNDGVNDIYSEWYKKCLVGNWNLQFPAAGPTRCTFNFQGDTPILRHPLGGSSITKQRGGTDNAANTNRLVHGMDDVREIVFYSPALATLVRLDDLCSSFEFTVSRNIRQDPAVGTSSIVNTAAGRPELGGRINAFVNDVVMGSSQLSAFLLSNPDDLEMHVVFGATDATAYGLYFSTVRVTASPAPVPGNDQALYFNAAFSAVNSTLTKF